MTLPDLRQPTPPLDPAVLQRLRGQLHAELAAHPAPRGHRFHLALCLLATTGLTLAAAAALGLSGGWASPSLTPHLPTLLLLLLVQGLGLVAAVAPRTRRLSVLAAGVALGAIALLVGGSHFVSPGIAPPWVCTVSHLGFDLVPLAALLFSLRFAAPSLPRALVGGLAVGSSGAFLGELACGRGMAHVAAYHLPAWLLAAGAAVLLSRVLRPHSYAP